MSSLARKLGLGTVQFGLAYGVTNAKGQVARGDVAAILAAARTAGIDLFDTAAAYGESEAVLGDLLPNDPALRLVSKVPPIAATAIGSAEIGTCRESVERSLARLRRRPLYGLLLHRAGDLLKPGGERLVDLLHALKETGTVAKIGLSAYDQQEIEPALRLFTPDLLQVPINILDQRLLRDGMLAGLHAKGIEIHARSVFLQGVLLADPATLPSHFAPWRDRLREISETADRQGLSRLALCLAFVLAQPEIDYVIVGVTSLAELRESLAAAEQANDLPHSGLESLAIDDARLLNPALWPSGR